MTIIQFDKIRDFTLQDYIRKCEIISDLIVFIHKIHIFLCQVEKDLVVGEILDTLGLTECRNTRSGLPSLIIKCLIENR